MVRPPSRCSAAAAAVQRGRACLPFLWRTFCRVSFLAFKPFLLALGVQAEIEAVDNYGATALHWAAQDGKNAVATQLVNANANVNAVTAYGSTPLHKAAYNGHALVADLLLAAGANPKAANKDGETPAQYAEQRGKRELAEHLRQA